MGWVCSPFTYQPGKLNIQEILPVVLGKEFVSFVAGEPHMGLLALVTSRLGRRKALCHAGAYVSRPFSGLLVESDKLHLSVLTSAGCQLISR